MNSEITKIMDPKDCYVDQLQPFDNMASHLGCAPYSISILGHLCLIATGKDFDLRVEGIDRTFEYLNYPESFRASLCQVTNVGYDAFLKADSSMQRIKLRTFQV